MSKQIYAISEDPDSKLPSFRFESLSEAARFFEFTVGTIAYHVKTGTAVRGYRLTARQLVANKNIKDQGIEGDGSLIQYATSSIKVCVTPCPYAERPKPKVGSASCMRCRHFLGKDIEKKIVRCNFKSGYSKI